jgi:hypothetical protein
MMERNLKMTKTARIADFVNANQDKNMDQVCNEMFATGLTESEVKAREWYRWVVNTGKAKGVITYRARGRRKGTIVAAPAMIEAPAQVVEEKEEVIELVAPTVPEMTKEEKLAAKRARDAARKREKRAAAKAAREANAA